MPVVLTGDIEGERQLSRRLLVMADGVKDWSEPLDRIGSDLRASFDTNFNLGGSLFGGWAPRKKSYPYPILQKTGMMRGSFEQQTERDFVKLHNTSEYFPFHQSNQPRSKLPRRVMMKIDQQSKRDIQKAFQEYIVNLIRTSKNG